MPGRGGLLYVNCLLAPAKKPENPSEILSPYTGEEASAAEWETAVSKR